MMIPGEIVTVPGDIELNAGRPVVILDVTNTDERPIVVGSHYHFAETNPALRFDRERARGHRLDLPAGTCLRFAPGECRSVTLVPYVGARVLYGFNGRVMGPLDIEPEAEEPPAAQPDATSAQNSKPAAREKSS